MRYIRYLLISITSLLLCGCSYFKPTSQSDVTPFNWQHQQPNCKVETQQNNNCPSITYNGLNFNKFKKLNTLINNKFLQILNAEKTTTLEEYLKNNLARANNGYHLNLSVQLMSENDVLIVLMLTVEEIPSTDQYNAQKVRFINFDKHKQKDITLKDAIIMDKTEVFWSTAQIAYKQWLEIQQLLNNETYQEDWPFIKTNNVALLPKQLMLKYSGNTLAPYAMGEPTLFIPYEQLHEILKPEYLPH
ncbi:hypothetical protein DKL61_00170 [Gammaproteobacteria bacterium ESL0073]|nr:hypothetical protein DKL61_00170 [Gammaproteobacteria bacterium ESL0073]